jgi:hypothetical protein
VQLDQGARHGGPGAQCLEAEFVIGPSSFFELKPSITQLAGDSANGRQPEARVRTLERRLRRIDEVAAYVHALAERPIAEERALTYPEDAFSFEPDISGAARVAERTLHHGSQLVHAAEQVLHLSGKLPGNRKSGIVANRRQRCDGLLDEA